jgi:hypothetical protein
MSLKIYPPIDFSNLLEYVFKVFPGDPLDIVGANFDVVFFISNFVDLDLQSLFC